MQLQDANSQNKYDEVFQGTALLASRRFDCHPVHIKIASAARALTTATRAAIATPA